ncbi:hypothetical protein SALBM311S_07533 [Streptomyces alboniger]
MSVRSRSSDSSSVPVPLIQATEHAARNRSFPRTDAHTRPASCAARTYWSVAEMRMSQGIVSGLSGSCARAAAMSGSGSPLKALKYSSIARSHCSSASAGSPS